MKIKLFANSGIFARNVVIDGFQMTGPLTLSRNPMTATEAATKRYVDNFPYNLEVENIVGGPLHIDRIGSGFSGDMSIYNGQTVLKSVVAAGSYSKVTVNAKGQIIGGLAPSQDNATPTLLFSEIRNRPTSVAGYVEDASVYVSPTENKVMTGALNLFRNPTTNTEAATFGYLTSMASQITGGYSVGDVVLKPNTKSHTGFLKCNGAVLDKSTYSALYGIIGDQYNSTGVGLPTDKFQLPDYSSRSSGIYEYYIKAI